ncbi:MAG: BamA/TamA family outer membrane protein, partial [Pseudomonadota bacterium]|nr:BamA/TamA family outer membrane protein [Pseudomonadota bacterium]
WSIGANIGYPINEFNRINFGLTYSNVELFNRGYYEQSEQVYNQFTNGEDPDAAIKYDSYLASVSWSRSTLNRGLFPTAGSSQRASFSITTPNSDVNYFKTVFDGKWYFPLSRNQRWSFLARMRLGYGNGYGDIDGNEQILPFTENFTAGGADSLRGFENNTVGPRGIFLGNAGSIVGPDGEPFPGDPANAQISWSQRSLGGNAMALGGIELIVPTPFVEEDMDNSVRTSLFVDVGNVWDTEFDYDRYSQFEVSPNQRGEQVLLDYSDWSLYRSSAGVSVQWISPMGPMVFSFSKAIQQREGDDARFFTFNIGQTF